MTRLDRTQLCLVIMGISLIIMGFGAIQVISPPVGYWLEGFGLGVTMGPSGIWLLMKHAERNP